MPIGPMDLLIAGHAISEGLILVTNYTREFCRVKGLVVEDWTREQTGGQWTSHSAKHFPAVYHTMIEHSAYPKLLQV